MQHRRLQAVGLALFVAFSTAACDDTAGPGDEHDSRLVGEWVAISSVLKATQGSGTVDLVTEDDAFILITINANGTAIVAEYDYSTMRLEEEMATWTTSGDQLTLLWEGATEPETVGYEVTSAGHFKVYLPEGDDWDFDGNGTLESTTQTLTFANLANSPDPALVAGWDASAYVYTSVADPTVSVDLIAEGVAFGIAFDNASLYTMTVSFPDGLGGMITESQNGGYIALQGFLWVLEGTHAEPGLVLYSITGTTMVVNYVEAFDFDDDGVDEPATVQMTFTKQ